MTGGPAPNPCASCPYRRDVPSGIWHPEEYEKLPRYDAPTYEQPTGLFLCHQTGADDDGRRVCAGWVGCHGGELLGLRLGASTGALDPQDVDATFAYESPVPLFASGAAAAAHGLREVETPSVAAVTASEKIRRRRSDMAEIDTRAT